MFTTDHIISVREKINQREKKKKKNNTAVVYTIMKQLILWYLVHFSSFSLLWWYLQQWGKTTKATLKKFLYNNNAELFSFKESSLCGDYYFENLKSWLPRVTTGVPSPMMVVKLISFSSILSSSITTLLMAGRLSLDGSTQWTSNAMNSSMPSVVKLLTNLWSMMLAILPDSW